MIKKAIIFSTWFQPPQELLDFCINELGMKAPIDWQDNNIRFNTKIIEFCKKKPKRLWNDIVYIGKETDKLRCGFMGAGYIRNIDISKKWTIIHNKYDAPVVQYVDIQIDSDFGEVKIVEG